MHLDGEITVENLTVDSHLSHLDINYVTSMASVADDQSQKQHMTVHYCDEVKFDTVTPKELQERLAIESVNANSFSSSRAESDIDDGCNGNEDPLNAVTDNSVHSFSLPSTSNIDSADNTDTIMVQYTKSTKNALLQSALNNPTIDETESNW